MSTITRALLILLCCLAGALYAQEQEKPAPTAATVTVVAEKQEEEVGDVPLSVSVFSAEQIENSTLESVSELAHYLPNLYFSEFAAKRTATPYIRGIGAGQGEPAVSTYIDGVPQLTLASGSIDLMDVARVEVLRGPQGSLYGRNTLGGLIHLIQHEPGEQFGAHVEAEAGEEGHQRLRLSLTGPITEGKAYYRVGGSFLERDGFTTNDFLGTDVDHRDSSFMRFQLLLTPTESWRIKISAHAQDDQDGGFLLYDRDAYRANPFHMLTNKEGKTERDLSATSAHITYHASAFDVTAVTAFDSNDVLEVTDLDFLPSDLLERQTEEAHDQFYQELRLSAEDVALGSLKLDWVLGLSYFSSELDHDAYTEVRPDATGVPETSLFINEKYTLEDSGLALFAHTKWTLMEQLDLTVGLRFERETKEWDLDLGQVFGGFPVAATQGKDEADFDDVLPRLGLTWRFDDQRLVYANAAKSYRPGGYNRNTASGLSYGAELYTYEAETGWSYELGFKGSWLDNRIYLALAAFSMDWEERQLSVPLPGLTGQFYLDNVAESTSDGFELELSAVLTSYLDLMVAYGTNTAEFDSYLDPFTGLDVKGNQLPLVADQNSHLGLRYHRETGDFKWLMQVSHVGIGALYYDNANSDGQGSVDLLNARLGVSYRGFGFHLWGKNLSDETYYPLAIPHTILPGSWAARPGNPRELGLTVSFRL